MLVDVGDLVRSSRRLAGAGSCTGHSRWRPRLDVGPIAGQTRLVRKGHLATARTLIGAHQHANSGPVAVLAGDVDLQTQVGGRMARNWQCYGATPHEHEQQTQE